VLTANKEFGCKGFNYKVTLESDRLILRNTKWWRPSSHELPIESINAVIVRRKSMVPFAALAALALIAAVLTRYNSLWFLINPAAENDVSTVSLAAAFLFIIPAVSRALFVDVIVSWAGRRKPFLVRFVPARQGRGLAKRFHGVSAGA
jgi:hypothetical protein